VSALIRIGHGTNDAQFGFMLKSGRCNPFALVHRTELSIVPDCYGGILTLSGVSG
jgi:hypothetical protein